MVAANEGRVYIDELEVFKKAMGGDAFDAAEALNPAVLLQVCGEGSLSTGREAPCIVSSRCAEIHEPGAPAADR